MEKRIIINILNLQKKFPVKIATFKKSARKTLLLQNKKSARLSIVFVDNAAIKKLNNHFLKKNYPTDVLAFDSKDPDRPRTLLEGEIIISLDMAHANARLFKTTFLKETILYMIHGILHLCGYADKTIMQKQKMRMKELSILEKIL
ncbi:rRNA maturation RNase YbeY [Candidatus Omnitrophota bacterium]